MPAGRARGVPRGAARVAGPVAALSRSAQRTAPGISSLEQPAELVHRQKRHAMRRRRRQREAAVGVADRVGEPRAAGDDEQRVARAELADRRAQCAQRLVAALAASPPPTLTTVSTARAARRSSAASATAGATSRPVARPGAGTPATIAPRRAATSRTRNRPEPTPTTGASGARACTRAAAGLDLATCSACRWRRDGVDLRGGELLAVGAHEPRDPLARARDPAARPSGVGQS